MKYRKASDVLPEHLLREVQKYVDGEALYFPKYKQRKTWGEQSGAQDYYANRNAEIRAKHKEGRSQDALALEYSLSTETVRKILFDKRMR